MYLDNTIIYIVGLFPQFCSHINGHYKVITSCDKLVINSIDYMSIYTVYIYIRHKPAIVDLLGSNNLQLCLLG